MVAVGRRGREGGLKLTWRGGPRGQIAGINGVLRKHAQILSDIYDMFAVMDSAQDMFSIQVTPQEGLRAL